MKISGIDFSNFLKDLLENEIESDGFDDEDTSWFHEMTSVERYEYLQNVFGWSDDDLLDAFNKTKEGGHWC